MEAVNERRGHASSPSTAPFPALFEVGAVDARSGRRAVGKYGAAPG